MRFGRSRTIKEFRTYRFVSGFTIIELLVVIAIIAILAALLFPVIAKAKDSGMKASALTQMGQLGKAFIMYTDESQDKLLPSTNYGLPDSSPEKLWTNNLMYLVKEPKLFVAPGSNGGFAKTWGERGGATIGYNSSTAIDRSRGCSDDQSDVSGCVAFRTVAAFGKQDNPAALALFAVTPGGEIDQKYLGYEFSPYNGHPNFDNPSLSPPLVSDRDLVKELGSTLPAELIKPIYARYLSSGSDDGVSPIIFGDGHVKSYSAKEIQANEMKLVWRLR